MFGLVLAGMTGCTIDSDATQKFTNQTDQTVWVGFNGFAPDGFRIPDSLWTEAPPGEQVAMYDGGCPSGGELVVAIEPVESEVIDVRPLTDSEFCPNDDWKWSGVGDHD